MNQELRPFWRNIFNFNWKFGVFLTLVVCIPRFVLVLNANISGNYGSIGIIMFVSAIIPFIFLSGYGRRKIGITRPRKYKWLYIAIVAGLIFSGVLYGLGQILYGGTFENWYYYIGLSYQIPSDINPHDKQILFMIMAGTGMIFSPIGEELFFRGIVHGAFAGSMGDQKASLVDSAAFALTHIAHFGLVFMDHQWRFLLIPAMLWVLSMFVVSQLFFILKKYSGSLLGAVIGHAFFNLGMIYCIFYLL